MITTLKTRREIKIEKDLNVFVLVADLMVVKDPKFSFIESVCKFRLKRFFFKKKFGGHPKSSFSRNNGILLHI